MYYYILDSHNIPQKDFERNQIELQTLLTEFKIHGELARITPLRGIPDLVDTAASRGAKTLVVCGTDETFHQVLAVVKDRDFTLAFIPFIGGTQLGRIFGMDDLATSVRTLASRRTEKIDAAKINGMLFLSYLELGIGVQTGKKINAWSLMKLFNNSAINLKLRIDDSYNISSKVMGGLLVNTRGTFAGTDSAVGNPQDSFLDLLLIEKLSKLSIFRNKQAILTGCYEKVSGATAIRCKKVEFLEPLNLPVYVDGREITRAPAVAEILPGNLRMIVGKNRTF